MIKKIIFCGLTLISVLAYSNNSDSTYNQHTNIVNNLLSGQNKLQIGGYGEVHYNQPIDGSTYNLGKLDVHRMVMLFGYNFNEKTQFISELEFEHVSEVFVEQAFLQYRLNNYLIFRGGLILVPMGIINEYHEPTSFNGVERPLADQTIAPTTWREIGFGVTGNILETSLKYQAYIINGFSGYNRTANLNGKNGLRKGRQKGSESYVSSPNFSGKIDYYGIRGLNIGLSGYIGHTQSTLYDDIDKDDDSKIERADSSIVGVSMVGLDTRYGFQGFQLRGQLYYTSLSNSDQYNVFTAQSDGTLNDLGSSMLGYYVEAGYDIARILKTEMQLVPYVRFEFVNTHHTVDKLIKVNKDYQISVLSTGLTLTLTKGAVVKADIQFMKDAKSDKYSKIFNAGFGVMF